MFESGENKWHTFSAWPPKEANTVTPFTVDLHEQLYRFIKGHRIMVRRAPIGIALSSA
jgi:predicted acyl esterase